MLLAMDSSSNPVGPRDTSAEPAAQTAGPRTKTQLDDVLTRSIGKLPPMAGLFLSFGLYAVLGVLLPLLLRTGRSWTIALGAFGASSGVIVLMSAMVALKQAGDRRRLIEWTSDLRKLDATEFEWLVGEVLRREGWAVTETGHSDRPDGNIDLRAQRAGRRMIVQCKRWAAKPVGVDEVRKLAGTASAESRADAVLVTLSDFTASAQAEAPRLRVQLIDGTALLERVERVRRSEPCPVCTTPMILDKSPRGWWLRCPRFPGCSGKRDLSSQPGQAVDLLLEGS